MSRQPTWDTACRLQADMFREAAAIGGLDIQLVYYRGLAECRASAWVSQAERLAELMERIDCRGGHTQIGKVLAPCARARPSARKVQALVFVGDAMEEKLDDLCQAAGELGLLGVPAFMFQEGDDAGRRAGVPRDRAADAAAPIAASIPARRTSSASCCARSRPMRPAACRRSPTCRRGATPAPSSCIEQMR